MLQALHCRQFQTIILCGSFAWCAGLETAEAHFLFLRLTPHQEAGRHCDVFFSESATAGDPAFVKKIGQTQLWLQVADGEPVPLEVEPRLDRLRAFVPAGNESTVYGRCTYGVLTRNTAFLLQYFPKAIHGGPAYLNRTPAVGNPLEIQVRHEGEGLVLQALKQGKPLPGAVFTTIDDDLSNEELEGDEKGEVRWTPPADGHYSVYIRTTLPESGEHNGTKYSEVRQFATVSFPWPLERVEPDAEAVKQFREAVAARAAWKNFPGFTAKVRGILESGAFQATLQVDADGDVTVESENEAAKEWLADQWESIVLHRQPDDGDESPVLYFADDDTDHPHGRLLNFVGGSFASSYRVKGDEIRVVNRNLGPMNMTITVLETQRNAEQKALPGHYNVVFWDARTGQLKRLQTVSQQWQRFGQWDLPVSHSVTESATGTAQVRKFKLDQVQLATVRPE